MNEALRPVRAVVFDLDGTLVDSMPMVLRAFDHALAPFCPPMGSDELMARLGGPPDRTFRQIIGADEHVPEAMERLRSFSLANWKLIQPFAGMHALLDGLQAAGCPVGVWTGRERESTEWILREQGLAPKISACVCGDDLSTHKPDPEGLLTVLAKLSAGCAEALFVGDADGDVLAGARAGVRTVLIQQDRVAAESVVAQAWRVVATPAGAYDWVRQLALT
jgi:HAD superfamily hydrolase (TIGR01509 family)